MTSPDQFTYDWSCVARDYSRECLPEPALCPEPLAHVCRGDVMAVSGMRTSFNSSALVIGITYTITVSVARNAARLPSSLSSFAHRYTDPSTASITFTAATGTHPIIRLRRCDASALGGQTACGKALSTRVRSGDRLAIMADVVSPNGGVVSGGSFAWSDVSAVKGQLGSQFLVTSLSNQLLVLRAGAVLPGHTVRFRLTYSIGVHSFPVLLLLLVP